MQEILGAPTNEILNSEGKPPACKYLETTAIKSPYKFVVRILNELGLATISENKLNDIYNDNGINGYLLGVIVEDGDEKRLSSLLKKYEEQSKKQLEFLRKPENREKISILRKAYQQLTNVVFFFFKNPAHPTPELNENFQYLYNLINATMSELESWQNEKTPLQRNDYFPYLPFSNLFSAVKIYKEMEKNLSWQEIWKQTKSEMLAIYGDIEEIYQEVGGSDVLAKSDRQEKLDEIQLFISALKNDRDAKKMAQGQRGKNGDRAQNQNKVSPKISLKLKSGNLSINQNTGEVKLNKVNADFNPTSKEFKILLNFTKNPDKQCKYEELIDGSVNIDSKRSLTFDIREIKVRLGILPAKKRKNKDIFKNNKRFGYRLI